MTIDKHTADGRREAVRALYAAISIFGTTSRAILAAHIQADDTGADARSERASAEHAAARFGLPTD